MINYNNQQSANSEEDEFIDVVGLDDDVTVPATNQIKESNQHNPCFPNPAQPRKIWQPHRFEPYRRKEKRQKRLPLQKPPAALTPPPETSDGAIEPSKKTKYNEKWGVKIFKTWLMAKNVVPPVFETWSESVLNRHLANFYTSVRKSDGDYYSRNSLYNLRAMINKHLKDKSVVRGIDIVVDDEFREANIALEQQLQVLRTAGMKINHKQPISDADLRKLYTTGTLSNRDPQTLLHKVWFETTYYFCSKPGESQDKWLTSSFVFSFDTELNLRYVTRKSEHSDVAVRMYETDDQYCPVRSLNLYISKLDTSRHRFFQHPKRQITDFNGMWYGGGAIGEKVLNSMMATISEVSRTEKRYTNHCVRATASELISRREGRHQKNIHDRIITHPTRTILPNFHFTTLQTNDKPINQQPITGNSSISESNLLHPPSTTSPPMIRFVPAAPPFTPHHDVYTQNIINAHQHIYGGLYMTPQTLSTFHHHPHLQSFFNTTGILPTANHQMLAAAAAAASFNITGSGEKWTNG